MAVPVKQTVVHMTATKRLMFDQGYGLGLVHWRASLHCSGTAATSCPVAEHMRRVLNGSTGKKKKARLSIRLVMKLLDRLTQVELYTHITKVSSV